MTRVKVVKDHLGCEAWYFVRTKLGIPVGSRMYSVAPKEGDELPPEPPDGWAYRRRTDADQAALKWNLYLLWVQKCRKANGRRSG